MRGPLDTVQEFHVALSASEMTRLMHSCDVLIAPEERFSLSTAEALAAGVPAVMTVAHREWEYELYAPQGAQPRLAWVTPEWARRWPHEEIWVARKDR